MAGDNGSLYFWDWKTGYNFQKLQTAVQPGSLDSEAGIFMATFDRSGCRLLTAEADKTIKVYKEDDTAVSKLEMCVGLLFCLHCALVFREQLNLPCGSYEQWNYHDSINEHCYYYISA